MTICSDVLHICENAKEASRILSHAPTAKKDFFLHILADALQKRSKEIFDANCIDLANARTAGLDKPKIDRLTISEKVLRQMIEACREVAAAPDPVGAMDTQWQRPNGLLVGKMRVPLGVIAMIYEARPNVTIDAAILCIKAGNAVILRGGSQAFHSNQKLSEILSCALEKADLPVSGVQYVPFSGHEAVECLCRMDKFIDVIIPRGGEKLIHTVCEMATMPVLKHYRGVCHAYVDKDASLEQACVIVENSKTQRPGVCNALEGLLVHRSIAAVFLPMLAERLESYKVQFRADSASLPLLGRFAVPQVLADRGQEFHDLVLTVTVVDDMDEALDYIAKYGSNHTEIICTENYNNAMRFLREVDASMVAVNASTRFNDGGELGLGAEIGISTSKLHAYGPMGIRELTTSKFVVFGAGQTRN